ncbi:MAG: PAS domain S-box protein [Gemmatimonadales bacterium]
MSFAGALRYLVGLVLAAAACLLGARLGYAVAMFHGAASPIWPPTGIGFAILVLAGPRYWPAVALAAAYNSQANGLPGLPGVLYGLGSTAALVVPAWYLRRRQRFDPAFERLDSTLRYLFVVALAAPLVSATIGVLALELSRSVTAGTLPWLWFNWWIGDVGGLAILAPVLITWLAPAPRLPAVGGRLDVLGIGLALSASVMLARLPQPLHALPAYPLVIWAALRLGPRATSLTSLLTYATSVVTVWAAQGAFVGSGQANLIFLGALHVSLAVTGLVLAASAAEQRRARRLEREADVAYRALSEASPFAIVTLDLTGTVTGWNQGAERLFGWTVPEVLGAPVPSIPPDRRAEFETMRQSVLEVRTPMRQESERVDRKGRRLEVEVVMWPLLDAEGTVRGTAGAVQDISARKRAERLEQATHHIAQAALTAGDLPQLSGAIHGIVGELMHARNLYIALHDDANAAITFPYFVDEREAAPESGSLRHDFTEWLIRYGHSLRKSAIRPGEEPAPSEATLSGADPSDWMGAPLIVAGRTIGVIVVQSYLPGDRYSAGELTILEFVSSQVAMAIERIRALEALRVSEARFRSLATTTNDIIWEWDIVERRDWWSESLASVLGYLPDDIPQGEAAWLELVHPDERERVGEHFHEALAGPTLMWRDEYRVRRKDGIYAWVLSRARIERNPAGTAVHVFGAMMDVTGLREVQAALLRSEDHLRHAMKLEAVGRLAGGVAHDFNNLLTSVLGHADLALCRVHPADPLFDDLMEISAAGTRAAALTQQLLAFSRKQVLEPRVVDLNTIVSGIARMLRRTIGENIELVTRLASDLGPVRADPVQLEQVLLNLAVNARDAMPRGGRLLIETQNTPLESGPGVRIRVVDSGVGMTEEVRAHLFEPFFTTKEVGKGTGLGLAMAYGIVQQSGGTITVTSEVGQGSTFVIELPQAVGESVTPVPPRTVESARGGSETVLLVEDEEAVRNLTRRVLEYYGYAVLSAPTGEAALALSRVSQDPIHLLLTDVVMPGMSGPELAEQLAGERPGLRRIFMSGYAATTLEQRILLERGSAFIQKPFTSAQLATRVRQMLDEPAPAAAGN